MNKTYKAIILFLIVIVFINCKSQKATANQSDIDDALEFQLDLNREHMDPTTTIFSKENLQKFVAIGGHAFYDIDKKFIVEANLEVFNNPERISFETSAQYEVDYLIYGKATFEIDDKPFELFIYKSASPLAKKLYNDHLFLPFTDLTSGNETYGGGRYIDLTVPKDKTKIIINFNKSFHPYCAYEDGYACPVPPLENHMNYKIEAGIKLVDLK